MCFYMSVPKEHIKIGPNFDSFLVLWQGWCYVFLYVGVQWKNFNFKNANHFGASYSLYYNYKQNQTAVISLCFS
jgi:hypothetical protein